MTSDPILAALRVVLAFTLAVVVVLALRVPIRRWLGARAAYLLWIVPVLVLSAALLPTPAATATVASMPSFPLLAAANARSTAAVASSGWAQWLAGAWTVGALALAAALVWLQYGYRRALRLTPVDASGVARSATLVGPALVGAWKPLLVLPMDFEARYPPRERALVLAHEAEHLRRGDARVNALAAALLCLFWFNPLAWWAIGRFRFDQELACDEGVLALHPDARRDYAAALFKTQLAADAGWRLPAGCHWAVRHPLKERITMLKRNRPARLQRLSGTVLVLGLGLACSVAAWAGGTAAPSADAAQPRTLHRLVAADRMDPPAYPEAARNLGVSGTVVLKILVGTDGRVADVKLVSTTLPESFSAAAMTAARQWTFVPGRDDGGKPLEGWVQVPVEFKL
jgi:TonB family protein